MSASPLWMFVHRVLSAQFHLDPARFVATLDGASAATYLERMWSWAVSSTGASGSSRPPLTYNIERPRPGLAIVSMAFQEAKGTGDPWHARFFVRDPNADGTGGYARLFLLEQSDYATEQSGGMPMAMVCESEPEGVHLNWGATFAPTDEDGFTAFAVATLRSTVAKTGTRTGT